MPRRQDAVIFAPNLHFPLPVPVPATGTQQLKKRSFQTYITGTSSPLITGYRPLSENINQLLSGLSVLFKHDY